MTAEARELGTLIPRAQVLPHPERGTVLGALPGHRVAHFACHGYADLADPAMSQLILYDYQSAPLTVADVSALRLTGSLAYLSACSTAVTSPWLANEAVHITGAFHLAGYQHVVGTLWPINDATASELARDFYDRLTQHSTQTPETRLAAQALHYSARQVRAAYPRTPTLWATIRTLDREGVRHDRRPWARRRRGSTGRQRIVARRLSRNPFGQPPGDLAAGLRGQRWAERDAQFRRQVGEIQVGRGLGQVSQDGGSGAGTPPAGDHDGSADDRRRPPDDAEQHVEHAPGGEPGSGGVAVLSPGQVGANEFGSTAHKRGQARSRSMPYPALIRPAVA